MAIKHLSPNKVSIKQRVNIILDNNIIETITINLRYKIINNTNLIMLPIDKIITKLSMKHKIKKKFIKINKLPATIDNYNLDYISNIKFDNKEWYIKYNRERIFRELFDNK